MIKLLISPDIVLYLHMVPKMTKND